MYVNKNPTDETVCRYLFTAKLSSFAVNKYLHIVASVGFLFTLFSLTNCLKPSYMLNVQTANSDLHIRRSFVTNNYSVTCPWILGSVEK